MEVFWIPLTLTEARGFVRTYTVSHRQVNGSNQQEEQDMAPGDVDRRIVTGLQEEETYYVQVWANTVAGAGVRSHMVIIQPPSTTEISRAIMGGVMAAALMATTVAFIVIVVAVVRCRKNAPTQDGCVKLI